MACAGQIRALLVRIRSSDGRQKDVLVMAYELYESGVSRHAKNGRAEDLREHSRCNSTGSTLGRRG